LFLLLDENVETQNVPAGLEVFKAESEEQSVLMSHATEEEKDK